MYLKKLKNILKQQLKKELKNKYLKMQMNSFAFFYLNNLIIWIIKVGKILYEYNVNISLILKLLIKNISFKTGINKTEFINIIPITIDKIMNLFFTLIIKKHSFVAQFKLWNNLLKHNMENAIVLAVSMFIFNPSIYPM